MNRTERRVPSFSSGSRAFGFALWLGVLLVLRAPHCTRTAPTSPAGRSSAPLRLALAPAAGLRVTAADSIRFTVLDSDGTVLCRNTFAFADHRGAVDPLPCGISVMVMIAILDTTGATLSHGSVDIASVPCDTTTVLIADSQLTPFAPSELSATPGPNRAITLSWRGNSANERYFLVERSQADSLHYDSMAAPTDTVWTDTGLPGSSAYRYAVCAVNAAGRSPRLLSGVLTTAAADTLGPAITVLSHDTVDTVHGDTATVFGTVTDPGGVAALRVNDSLLPLIDNYWSIGLTLQADSITIEITAVDSAIPPNRSRVAVTLRRSHKAADTIPPRLTVLSHADGDTVYTPSVSLFGTVSDDGGVDSVTVGGVAAQIEGFVWRTAAPLVLEPGVNLITVVASDASHAANDTAIDLRLSYLDPCTESVPPRITILSHGNPDTVNTRLITVLGSAAGPNGAPSVTCNDTPLTLVDNVWEVPGYYLNEGRNRIVIAASDSCTPAHTARETLLVWYIPTYVDPPNHAPYITVGTGYLSGAVKAGREYRRVLTAGDPDPYDRHTFLVSPPLALVDDTTIGWTPAIADTGTHPLWAVVLDQDSAGDSVSWSVSVLDPRVNTAPGFVTTRQDMNDSVMVGRLYRDTVAAIDLDQDSGLSYTLAEAIGAMSIGRATGIVSWRPDTADLGVHAVTAIVTDDSGATARLSWPLLVYDPSLPVVNAGRDTTVSIGDTVRLHGTATSASGTITTYEWALGAAEGYVPTSTSDTFLVAPDTVATAIVCRFRATDSFGRANQDSTSVRVVLDSPVAEAGRDTVVWLGQVYRLAGSAVDGYGTIARWEWDVGATGSFVTAPSGAYTGTAPSVSGPLVCVLRVTDDDGLSDGDTMTVHVVGGSMRIVGGDTTRGEWVRYVMASTGAEPDELPPHPVRVTPFMVDSSEVTQREYVQLMGVNPSTFMAPEAPAEGMTWYDAALFCNERSRRGGYDTVYSYTGVSGTPGAGSILSGVAIHYDRIGYRLPTEAEWELACGAGIRDSAYAWGNDTLAAGLHAWHAANAGARSHEVAMLHPNYHDLYDMAGNVWEWCNDWYSSTYYQECAAQDTVDNPAGPLTGTTKVIRGGSWQDGAYELRTANRGLGLPSWSSSFVGFRCVLGLR